MQDSGQALPDWRRAHGAPLIDARLRSSAEDFVVHEVLGFDAAGDGEHDLLHIEKVATNTAWLARRLAAHAGVPAVDVGYAGLKDRDAVTRQYFTVRRPNRDGTDWAAFSADGVQLLSIERHNRKLRRGAHAANRFRLALRSAEADAHRDALEQRWAVLTDKGVPNYFGAQRFGHGGSNLDLARAVLNGRRVKREKRSIALSAARSFLFNEILSARIANGNWNRLLQGDLANLDGSGSVFAVDEVTPELSARCAAKDLHPSGSLWGDGAPRVSGDAAALERAAVADYADLTDGLCRARLDAGSRPLRLCLAAASIGFEDGVVWLEFELPAGGYATSVVRELVNCP